MVSFLVATFGAILFGLIIGAAFAYLLWHFMNKYFERKEKRNINVGQIKDQFDHTKPEMNERRLEEDERRRVQNIREFEKLRRGKGQINSNFAARDRFYASKFEDGERRRIQNEPFISDKQSVGESGQSKVGDKRDTSDDEELDWS